MKKTNHIRYFEPKNGPVWETNLYKLDTRAQAVYAYATSNIGWREIKIEDFRAVLNQLETGFIELQEEEVFLRLL